ncbi:glycosyltransferase family 4 protein [Luteimonas sp. SMYT11W]|uniref:Glycosyltransferase family 4 protein n=1 Tax=Luteimonas flava TaxID=3115822 RepID=A0ABU7WJX6_9GAMM
MTEATLHRILHVTRNLPPLVGGMERLNWHIADGLSRCAQVHVVGPRGAAENKPFDVDVQEVPLRPLWWFLLISAWQAFRLARKHQPALVLAGSGLTAPAAWLAARACGGRAAVYVHGLDISVRHPVYRALWHPFLRRMDVVIANSRPTAVMAHGIGIAPGNVHVVHPGVALPEVALSDRALRAFRERHAVGDAPLLLSVGRLTQRKGLREFVREAFPAIVRQVPNVQLMVIGDAAKDSLLPGMQSRDDIQAAADAAGVGAHLRFLGGVSDLELASAYEAANVHVFPVIEVPGDPEGFGMVAIEAAGHGLPTVAFAVGGIVDAVQEGESGRLVAQADYPALASAVVDLVQRPALDQHYAARRFAERFAWPHFHRDLWAALMPDSTAVPAALPSANG